MASTLRNLASKVLLLLIGAVAVIGIAAFSPSNAYAASYNIYVGGVQVTDANKDDVLGDGTVRFWVVNDDWYGLDLTDASIPVAEVNGTDAAAIYVGSSSGKSMSIYIEGDNEIYMPDEYPDSKYMNGISYNVPDYKLEITGEGSLSMSVSDLRDSGSDTVYGIYSEGWTGIYDIRMDMDLSASKGLYGINSRGSVELNRCELNMYASGKTGIEGIYSGNYFRASKALVSISCDLDLEFDGYSYGLRIANFARLFSGSDVSIQLPATTNEARRSAGVSAASLVVGDNSSLHAFAGWSKNSYGVYFTDDSGDNLEVSKSGYLEACGSTGAFNDGVGIDEETKALGAMVNAANYPQGATSWDGSTNLSTYEYVAIPKVAGVSYRSGVEGSTSWQGWKYDGAMSGTSGQGLRMEGLQIELENKPFDGSIEYRSQLQSEGWQGWKKDGATSGYAPKKTGGKRLEAVEIKLTGEMANHFDVWYHLQVQRFGWMGWVKNGETAGSVGYGFRVEAVEIVLTPRGMTPPVVGHSVATPEANMLSFVRCRSYDNKTWQSAKGEGDVSGTRNQTKTQVRVGLAASSFSAAGINKGNSVVQVRVYQDGKWSGWSSEDDAYVGNAKGGPIRGIQARIKPGTTLDSQYNLWYRVEVKDGSGKACWLGWAENGETAGQSNINLEQVQFSLVRKGYPDPPTKKSDLQPTVEHSKQRWVIERWPCNWPKPAYRF